jgi:hypothetical protein
MRHMDFSAELFSIARARPGRQAGDGQRRKKSRRL